MRKTYLPLLVVALFMSIFMWLLESETVRASGEGGNNLINISQPKLKEPIKYTSPIELMLNYENSVELAKKVEELEKRIQELEIELEKYTAEQDSNGIKSFDYYVKNGKKDFYNLTAYTSGRESTGKDSSHPLYGVTASGEKVKENYTIACPKELKFGTQVYIPSLENVYVCTDRGGAIKNKIIDVYIADLSKALEFGRKKKVELYIVEG